MKKSLFIIPLVFVFLVSSVTAEWQVVGLNDPLATCSLSPYPDAVKLSNVRINGETDQIECTYSCNFAWGDPKETGKTSTPLSNPIVKVIPNGGSVSLSDTEINDHCCSTESDVCFSTVANVCYYRGDSSCSSSTHNLGASCTCSRSVTYLDGHVDTETFNTCTQCANLKETCPAGTTYVRTDANNKIICEENPTVTPSIACVCPDEPIRAGESIICDLITESGSWKTDSHKHNAGDDSVFYPQPDVPCNYHVDERTFACRCPANPSEDNGPIAHGDLLQCAIYDKDSNENIYAFDADTEEGAPTSFQTSYRGRGYDCSFEVKNEEVVEQPEQPLYMCDCPDDPLSMGQSVRCTVTQDGRPVSPEVKTPPFTYSTEEEDIFQYNYRGQTLLCKINTKNSMGNLFCAGCVLKNPSGRKARDYHCKFARDGNIVEEFDTRVEYHGDPFATVNSKIDPSVSCQIPISTGCNSDGKLNGVCPTNCKSWEDPDCDFGPTGLRVVDWLFQTAGLSTPQQWWNEQLSGDGAIGKIYSALDWIPGTPEWFTDQVCKVGLEVSDDKACGILGLSAENCSKDWEGYRVFEGDIVVSLAAEYVSENVFDERDHYRLSWRLVGINETEQYRVFLANRDSNGYGTDYDGYSTLPQNRKYIYPEDGGWTPAESSSYEFITVDKFTDACIEFKISSNAFKDTLLDALGVTETPFICRKIRFYN